MMKAWMNRQIISYIYGVIILLPIELILNIYRFSRIAKVSISTTIMISSVLIIISTLFGLLWTYKLTAIWVKTKRQAFLPVLLWFPYFLSLMYLIATLFPMTYEGDRPNPVSGLIMIASIIIYPIVVFGFQMLGMHKKSSEELL